MVNTARGAPWRSTLQRNIYRAYGALPIGAKTRIVRALKPTWTVGTLIWIERDDEVLLVRNAQRHGWGLPGGLLDRGEYPEQCALREVFEETGLEVTVISPAIPVLAPRPHRIDLIFMAGAVAGSPRIASGEILEIKWWPANALPPLQSVAAEAYSALVNAGAVTPSS
jgi:8-oxo-dGTP diphosphatase